MVGRRGLLAALLILGLAVMLSLSRPLPALAHAEIERAEPPDACAALAAPRLHPGHPRCARGVLLETPPTTVQVWFSESVQPVAGGIRVVSPTGRRVNAGPTVSEGTALSVPIEAGEDGTYLVFWQVIAEDTHPARGRFAFSVGRESDPAADETLSDLGAVSPVGLVLQVAARWLHFSGFALSFGIVGFRVLVLAPLQHSPDALVERRLWRLVNAGTIVLVLAEVVALLAQTSSIGVSQMLDVEAIGSVLGSSFGRVWAQRLGAALLLWATLGAVREAGTPRAAWVVLGLGMLLAVVDGQATHAANTRPLPIGLVVNGAHLAAMGVWLGCILGVLAVWHVPGLVSHRRAILSRTARPIGGALMVLAASGLVMAWQHLGSLADLTATSYGRTLAAKLTAIVLALALAGLAARAMGAWSARWRRWEVLALLVVLALAGLLVSLPPRQ